MENLNKTEKIFFGQPRGLLTLFQTEFWERFSYYGMRAILVYYLYAAITDTNAGLGLPQSQAMAIVSIYGSLVYLSAVVGGWVADRLFGASQTVFIGGVLITFGHIALATPFGMTSLFVALALIILGTGMLKPNISNMVGQLYSKEDPRRDTGFSLLVVGINMGSLIAPLVVGTVGKGYNYHLGFSLAAIGMVVALFVYWMGRRKQFPEVGRYPSNPMNKEAKVKFFISLAVVALVAVVGFFMLYQANPKNFIDNFINALSIVGIVVPILYFVAMFTSKKVESDERRKLTAYIPLFISAIVFWAIEEQSSSVIAIWGADRSNLNPTWLGVAFHIDPTWFQLLNPLFIILLSPIFVRLWNKLGDRQPSTIVKFGLGLILTGLSYLIMTLPGLLNGTAGRASALWLVLMFAIQMAGELLVSPVGLSVSTKLAPLAFQSQMMAMWFLADSTSQAINAQITPLFTKSTEVQFFGIVGAVGILIGIILFFIKKPILKLMGDVR